jgi:endogenous inhibitor of DNA gyrase (YacG/DUF329 family)
MPKESARSMHCPICRKIVLRSDPEFPFCSERCRLIDLGAWLSEKHAIPDETLPGESGTSDEES